LSYGRRPTGERESARFDSGDVVPYPNDRRKHQADPNEVLSPEYLAMLIACGGEVREADLEQARRRPQQPRHGRRKDDLPLPSPEPDRRRET
jgi:hypothetical protein